MPDPPPSPHLLSYAQPTARHSRAGVISLVCGHIAIFSPCLLFVALAPGTRAAMPPIVARIIIAFAYCVVLLGLVTGIAGILRPGRKRGMAIVGLVLNGLVVLGIVGMIAFLRSGLRS